VTEAEIKMAESYAEAEVVLDDELVFDEPSRRRSVLSRRDERPESIVREGEVLAGKYRVERIPGRSGLGVVVQVRHVDLGQEVTLKFLVPEACAYPEFVQRFVREARSAVKIHGEHVARVTDVGRLESGAPYMVREFLRGPDLSEVLKVRGQLPVAEAVDYIIQACEGVAEGHALGVVHRNLRPTTLIITRRSDGAPLVKVIDFGAAESLHINPFTERSVSLVGTSAIMSSLPYMAPEQIRDPQDVDARADVYALGAILHELLTGAPVYQADSAPALLAAVAADGAPPVRDARYDTPGELDYVVLRCLAKNRAVRYASMGELVTALAPFASTTSSAVIQRITRLSRQNPALLDANPTGSSGSSRPAPRPSVAPNTGPSGTMIMPAVPPPPQPPSAYAPLPVPTRGLAADDVTVTQPLHHYQPLMQEQSMLRTPQPPPLRPPQPAPRRSEPPPLRQDVAAEAPQGAGNTSRYVPPHVPPSASQGHATVMPPRRSSLPAGVSRSWAPNEEDTVVGAKRRRRLVGVAAVAAFSTLGIFLGLRIGTATQPAASAAKPTRAVELPPAAPPAPVTVATPAAQPSAAIPAASAEVAPVPAVVAAPAVATPAVAAPAVAAPAVAAAPVAAPVAAAPVAAAPVAAPVAPVAATRPVPAAPRVQQAPRAAATRTKRSDAAQPQEPVAAAPVARTRDLFASPD
jgi:eukaryotic-like serine/threonine-protein kinase